MTASAAKIEGWTTAQAAYIFNEDPEAFTRAVDKTPVTPTRVQRGRVRVRYFQLSDLVYLQARNELKGFKPAARAEIYEVLKASDVNKLTANTPALRGVKVPAHLVYIRKRLKALARLEGEVDTSQDPPVIRGTKIEAYRVAGLMEGGMSVAEVLDEYPSLTREKVVAAKAFAESTPKRGRPFPVKTAKAAMRDVDLSVLDAFADPRE